MATNNAWNSENPAQVARGGTGAATLTANGVLYGNGTSPVAATSAGSAGQVLTSNGASAPTYQAAAGAAYLVLIQSQTASSSSQINFSSGITSTYNSYLFVWSNVVPATNTDFLQAQISTDGGSTFATGLQAGVNYVAFNSTTATNVNSTTIIPLTGPLSSTASLGTSGRMSCYGVTSGQNFFASALSVSNGSASGAGTLGMVTCGSTTASVNYIRFTMSTGNISTGKFTLYGILEA